MRIMCYIIITERKSKQTKKGGNKMNKAQKITEKAMKTLRRMTTEKLLELWEETENSNDENIPTVRGWLIEVIEERNAEAFEKWLEEDAEDRNLRKYILA